MTDNLNIILNGEPAEVPGGATVDDLLHQVGLADSRVAVEMNGEIVPASQHGSQAITDQARIEIVHAIGGG